VILDTTVPVDLQKELRREKPGAATIAALALQHGQCGSRGGRSKA